MKFSRLIELSNKSIIKVKGYDEIADYVYSNIKNGDIIIISGELRIEDIIEMKEITKIN